MKHLYLDLEHTITESALDGWVNVSLINVEKVRNFIAKIKPDKIHIFSYAIYNDFDRGAFTRFMLPRIEDVLDITVDDIITVKSLTECLGVHSTTEVLRLGKEHGFNTFAMSGNTGDEMVLLDDSVSTSKNGLIYLQNVDEL